MPIPSDNEVRHAILEFLNKSFKENPESFGIDRLKMRQTLTVPENQMDSNMLYLKQKGLVKLHTTMDALWGWAVITAFGMDVVENKDTFASKFPFIKVTNQNISGNVYGNAIQSVDSQITFTQNVTNSFKKAIEQTDGQPKIDPERKEEIKKTLRDLEEELRKNKDADVSSIKKAWEWLKRNANWVVPTLSQVVLEGIKIAYGFP